MTTTEIWAAATRRIHPTKPMIPGIAFGLHPKMQAMLGRLGWNIMARREQEARRRALAVFEMGTGIVFVGSGS